MYRLRAREECAMGKARFGGFDRPQSYGPRLGKQKTKRSRRRQQGAVKYSGGRSECSRHQIAGDELGESSGGASWRW